MKKTIFFLLLYLLIYFYSFDLNSDAVSINDFNIYQSYIFSSADYKRTELKVIIPSLYHDDTDKIFERIKGNHDRMNGVSDELKIELYDTKRSLLNGDTKIKKVFMIR